MIVWYGTCTLSDYCSGRAPPMSELSDDLRTLVNTEMFSDVKLWVDGQCFYAHRAILSARSSYFESMFCSGMRESTQADIKIPDVSGEAFEAVLVFIYTNTLDCPPRLYVSLLRGKCIHLSVYVVHASRVCSVCNLHVSTGLYMHDCISVVARPNLSYRALLSSLHMVQPSIRSVPLVYHSYFP